MWSAIILAEGGVGVGFPFFSRHERITVQLIVEPNTVSKGKEAHVPHFTEDSLRRIIINPIYTITGAPQLTEEHEPVMDETEWVRTNVTLIGEMGAARWLRQLLDILESKAGVHEEPINPFQAMNIDPLFSTRILRSSNGRCGSTPMSCTSAIWAQKAGSGSCWTYWTAIS